MAAPRFRQNYQPVQDGRGTVVMAGETGHIIITDDAVADVAARIDGVRELSDIMGDLATKYPLARVLTAYSRLQRADVLAETEPAGTLARTAAWDARNLDPRAADDWQRAAQVPVLNLGAPSSAAFLAALKAVEIGVRELHPTDPRPRGSNGGSPHGRITTDGTATSGGTTAGGEPVDGPDTGPHLAEIAALLQDSDSSVPVVVIADNILDPRLAEVNRLALEHSFGWILVRPHGVMVLCGPHFVPGETGCWECLRQRVDANEQVQTFLVETVSGDRINTARAMLPGTAAIVAGLLATELPAIAVTGRSAALTGRMLSLESVQYQLDTHTLVRQPQCAACGDPDLVLKAAPKIDLVSQQLMFSEDGGHRTMTPQQTYERIKHHVSPLLGVVTALVPLDGYSNGVTFSYGAGHNFALGNRSVGLLKKNLRGQSGGKGRSEIQAKVSAAGEAMERYSGVWRSDRPVHQATYEQLGADRAVHPRELLLFSDKQYAERQEWNAAHAGSGFQFVPKPLADDASIAWATAWSLTHQAPREVSAGYAWFGHPDILSLQFCAPDANGCAGGNTLEEAILQGFCELVERDAVALWWYHRSRVPGVDLDSLADPWLDQVRTFYATELHRSLWLLDITSDLGIPVYVAVSHRLDSDIQDPLVGFGAHLDPQTAARRALTEINQFLPTLTGRNADGSTRYGLNDPDSLNWFTTAKVDEQQWLQPDPDIPLIDLTVHSDLSSGDIATDVTECVDRAGKAGLEVIAMDQSRPELEIKVARVMVPGLRHFWRRLAPGRLYDVPPTLDRTPVARTEDDINPYSVFF